MGIGLGIFLIALGLILALGVRDRLADFDLSMIGWILTGVGALAIILSFIVSAMRRQRRADPLDRPDDIEGP